MAGKSSPVHCILAFLDPLLRCASLVAELHHIAGFPSKVRHNETGSWKKLHKLYAIKSEFICHALPGKSGIGYARRLNNSGYDM
jgi:hypothetical protein